MRSSSSRTEREARSAHPALRRGLVAVGALASLLLLFATRQADAATARALVAATVTVEQASSQNDPTNGGTIAFTATFNQSVTGFDATDVTIGGTAGATTAAVSGGPTTYTISVSGMTHSGTVTAAIAASRVTEGNAASTSTDNTVTYDSTKPDVTINQGGSQADPTTVSPIVFTAVFSEPVTGFADGDVTLEGTAGATTANVSGSGTTYTISVTGMISTGTVIAKVGANKVTDLAGNQNTASTSTDNTVNWAADTTKPTVTVDQGPAQADPTSATPIVFKAVFSEPVTGFASGDVTLDGTAGATTAAISGSGTTYLINVTGMTQTGTVIAKIGADKVADANGNGNTVSTSTDNTVTYAFTTARPTVTVNQAASQADPTSAGPVAFTAVFSEPVTGFAPGDVTLSGTAGATAAAITGSGSTYTINVSGMTQGGTVIASIAANVVTDAGGDGNFASTSTDNTVTVQSSTTLSYTGDKSVVIGGKLNLAAKLTTTSTDTSCRGGKSVGFYLDKNPGPLGSAATLPGVDGSWFPLATATSSGEGSAATQVQANGWAAGTYRVLAYGAATTGCPAASGSEALTVGAAHTVASVRGVGWIRSGGITQFRLAIAAGDAGSVRGWISVANGRRWKLVGAPTSVTFHACDEGQCADVSGTGRLYERSRSESHRTHDRHGNRQRWTLRSGDAQFTLHLVDGGSRDRRDRFGIAFSAPELAGLRGTTGSETASVRRGFVEIRG